MLSDAGQPSAAHDAGGDASASALDASWLVPDGSSGQPAADSPEASAPPAAVDAPLADANGLPGAAPFAGTIRYLARPGGVTLYLPSVPLAADYRVYALADGVRVSLDDTGGTRVDDATIACAGLVQHNQCDSSEAITSYGPNFRVPHCSADARALDLKKRVLTSVGLDGLRGRTKVVVEALDRLCPFPGAFGASHAEIAGFYDAQETVDATFQGKAVKWRLGPKSFPIRSEQEIRADYGSLILNGQQPPPVANDDSPWLALALPAPARHPKVLQRAVITVDPLDERMLPRGIEASDFFESFSDPTDQPKKVASSGLVADVIPVQNAILYQTRQLNLFTQSADSAQFFVHDGVLRSVLPDLAQDVMASNTLSPRRAFALPDNDESYLHVTYEVQTDASQRRYWWFYACGSDQAGKTIVDGRPPDGANVVPRPGFMNPLEGSAISGVGWNCLQIVPRGGSYELLSGSPYPGKRSARAETDLRVVINPALARPTQASQLVGKIANVSPAQLPMEDGSASPSIDGTWYRQWDAGKSVVGVMLDDSMFVEQRVRFDVYFNRQRIVLFANDVQKLCNDFSGQRLTMADTMIGIGHVFYHSYAERMELMREDWLRTGQYQYLHNLPFIDPRSFDNVGVHENASLPAEFLAGACYSAR